MTFYFPGQVDVRAEVIDETLKGFAKRKYKMKQLVNVETTGAWINYFFRADPNILSANRNANVRGVPRGAAYPQAATLFEKVRTDIEKYGLQDAIPWEDIISGQVNIRDQTLMRIAEGVTYAVDTQIFSGLTSETTVLTFNTRSYAGVSTTGWAWNHATAASVTIADDLEYAEELIASSPGYYDTSNLLVAVSPKDKRSVMRYLLANGAQIPQITNEALGNSNGVIGRLGNKTFIVSPVVTASTALVVVPKVCATWKELYPLTTDVTTTPLKNVTITAAELGVLQVTDPKAICWIRGTQV